MSTKFKSQGLEPVLSDHLSSGFFTITDFGFRGYIDLSRTVMNSTTANINATDNYELASPTENYAVGVYLLIIIVVSVLANLLVLLVLGFRKRRLKTTHFYIVALACSDILFSIAIHPMLISVSFGLDPYNFFGHTGCNWYGFGAVFFGSLSMLLHGSISFTRYTAVTSGPKSVWHKTWPNNLLLMLDILLAFTFAIAPVYGWGRYETFEFGCTIAFHDSSFRIRSYVITTMVVVLFLPLATCLYFNVKITKHMQECRTELFVMVSKQANPSITSTGSDITEDTTWATNTTTSGLNPNKVVKLASHRSRRQFEKSGKMALVVNPSFAVQLYRSVSKAERELTRVTSMTSLGFIIAWSPFFFLCLLEMAYPPTNISINFRVVASLFCKSATAYNPFIYLFMSADFRRDCVIFFSHYGKRFRDFTHKSSDGSSAPPTVTSLFRQNARSRKKRRDEFL